MVNETNIVTLLGLLFISVVTGGGIALMGFTIGAFFMRKSFTNEPLFAKEEIPEPVIEIIEETEEERFDREKILFKEMKGQMS